MLKKRKTVILNGTKCSEGSIYNKPRRMEGLNQVITRYEMPGLENTKKPTLSLLLALRSLGEEGKG